MNTQLKRTRLVLCVTVAVLLLTTFHTPAFAQYVQFNLVSSEARGTAHVAPHLINGWGLAFFPTSPFWVANNGTGTSTLYDHSGTPIPLVVTIPPAPSQPFGPQGTPTGIVTNNTGGFMVSENGISGPALFIFDTEDGTISGWNPNVDFTNAVIAVDNSASSALYTGLAFAKNSNGAFLYAADAVNNKIDMFDSNFQLVKSFTDPNPPPGLAVYGIQNVHGKLYVTLATPFPLQGGAIDIFNTDGKFVRRLTANGPEGPLQAPWGTALAPSDFGPLSDTLLIGNVDDGHINAFDPKTGAFLGMMTRPNGNPVSIGGLWALQFGAGSPNNGNKNELFFTAGPAGYRKGLFGMIQAKK
jgi:uncharacterized protein (TIGR03118 family)